MLVSTKSYILNKMLGHFQAVIVATEPCKPDIIVSNPNKVVKD